MSHVLIVGAGGREHALTWKLSQSPRIRKLFIAPGNAGTGEIGENVPIATDNVSELAAFAQEKHIDLTVVGPDNTLARGIVDLFTSRGLRIWGPTRAAAQIEASKAFAKDVMREGGIPTAVYGVFTDHAQALMYVREHGAPIVVKASGLALGKGVYVCQTVAEAEEALRELMVEKVHNDAGDEVVIEEYLDGEELSLHALCDGEHALMFPASQDHKTIGEGGVGKNTGGMGTIAPLPQVDAAFLAEAQRTIVEPALRVLREKGAPFVGILYPGIKLTSRGPRVLEFNARFGDPETQVYMRLLDSDLLDLLEASVECGLEHTSIAWKSMCAANIVLASQGYPDAYKTGIPVRGLDAAANDPNVVVFHAGTVRQEGVVYTAGGRVFGVSGVGETLKEACVHAYRAADLIEYEGKYFRRDIGAYAQVMQ